MCSLTNLDVSSTCLVLGSVSGLRYFGLGYNPHPLVDCEDATAITIRVLSAPDLEKTQWMARGKVCEQLTYLHVASARLVLGSVGRFGNLSFCHDLHLLVDCIASTTGKASEGENSNSRIRRVRATSLQLSARLTYLDVAASRLVLRSICSLGNLGLSLPVQLAVHCSNHTQRDKRMSM